MDKKIEVIQGEAEIIPTVSRPLVHPMSALCLIALDALSGGGEILTTPTGVGVVLFSLMIGIVTLIATTSIETGLNKKPLNEALAVGMTLAILAAVPYPVAGTAAGLIILGWSGLKRPAM